MSDDRHEAVSRRAYELWEKEGGVHGRHDEHWHQAAGELDGVGSDSDAAPIADEAPAAGTAAPDGTTMEAAPAATAAPKRAPRTATATAAKSPRKPKTK